MTYSIKYILDGYSDKSIANCIDAWGLEFAAHEIATEEWLIYRDQGNSPYDRPDGERFEFIDGAVNEIKQSLKEWSE